MTKRLLAALLLVLMAPAAFAQIPGPNLIVDGTPISGGTTGDCLTVGTTGKLSQAACAAGSTVTTFSGDTTGLTPATPTSGAVVLAGTLIGANGGTGVANTGKTITLGGNLTTTGAFNATFAIPGTGTWTFPVAGSSLAPLTSPTFVTSITMPSVAWASVPAPGTAGAMVRVSNFGTKGALLMDDGTRWKPASGCTVLASLDSVSSSIPNSETVVLQYQLAANMLQTHDRLRFFVSASKSGTTDSGLMNVRVGTAGTTADTLVTNSSTTILAAANRTGGQIFDFRLDSATTIQQLPNANANNAGATYGAVGNSAFGAAITITSAAANALFVSLTLRSSSTNDTVALQDGQIQLCSSAN